MQTITPPLKTGLIYDPSLLLHKCGRKHPQRPQRVQIPIQHLTTHHYLTHPHISYISSIPPILPSLLLTCHSPQYITHVNTLWSPDIKKKHINVLDSYFNQHSRETAELAVGGAVIGVDKIMKGEWKNGFAVVRPPGHHSGFRNVINGFCVYNNVAIAAKYLREEYKVKKVLIFDWDIHHGDGTQHIFREEQDILFISLHRYDRGFYYPGESGDYHNIGSGKAEGYHINMPWNTNDSTFNQYQDNPGDNQYIYVFQRLLLPIIRKFNPQFIFISAGFDSARSDPIGGFRVSPDCFHYLTTRLMQICPKILAVLEGGYNFQAIANCIEAVLQAMLRQELRNPENKLSMNEKRNKCWLPQYYHENVDEVVKFVGKYWPVVEGLEWVEYEEMVKGNKGREFGVYVHESSSQSGEDGSGSSLGSEGKEERVEKSDVTNLIKEETAQTKVIKNEQHNNQKQQSNQ